jgi:predicted permease
LKRAAGTGRSAHAAAGRILVTLEITAAVVVMIGAALLAKSLLRYQNVDRGFRARDVLSASVTLPPTRYPSDAARRAFFDAVILRMRALPAVESAAAPAGIGVLSKIDARWTLQWADGADAPGGDPSTVGITDVGAGYFRTFEIPIRRGRECDAGTEHAAVVNERLARRFGGRSPLGEILKLSDSDTFTVIGVATDVRSVQSNAPPMPMVFTCVGAKEAPDYAYIAVRPRAGTDAASLAPALRAAVAAVDPAQPIAEVSTLRQELVDAVAPRQFNTLLFGGFAVLAFTLSIFGLYAVTASLVAGRTREFGIRMALGAGRVRVLQLVLRQGLAPAASGLALGLLASFMLTRLLRAMLFEVEVLDAGAFAAVPLVLAFVSLAAAIIPARRAVRVDPVVALRCD